MQNNTREYFFLTNLGDISYGLAKLKGESQNSFCEEDEYQFKMLGKNGGVMIDLCQEVSADKATGNCAYYLRGFNYASKPTEIVFLQDSTVWKSPFSRLMITPEEFQKIFRWNENIKTDRKTKITTCRELFENLVEYERAFGKSLWIKSKNEDSENVCCEIFHKKRIATEKELKKLSSKELKNVFGLRINQQLSDPTKTEILSSKNSTEPILVSEYMNITQDNLGRRRWTAIVIDRKLNCLIRKPDNVISEESDIIKKVQEKVWSFNKVMPSCYRFTFFEKKDKNGNITLGLEDFYPLVRFEYEEIA